MSSEQLVCNRIDKRSESVSHFLKGDARASEQRDLDRESQHKSPWTLVKASFDKVLPSSKIEKSRKTVIWIT